MTDRTLFWVREEVMQEAEKLANPLVTRPLHPLVDILFKLGVRANTMRLRLDITVNESEEMTRGLWKPTEQYRGILLTLLYTAVEAAGEFGHPLVDEAQQVLVDHTPFSVQVACELLEGTGLEEQAYAVLSAAEGKHKGNYGKALREVLKAADTAFKGGREALKNAGISYRNEKPNLMIRGGLIQWTPARQEWKFARKRMDPMKGQTEEFLVWFREKYPHG